ncbi:MAG: hypothetical protein ACI9D0_000772 [Bacteroidia bacterium]|jgi:hypothetical protein
MNLTQTQDLVKTPNSTLLTKSRIDPLGTYTANRYPDVAKLAAWPSPMNLPAQLDLATARLSRRPSAWMGLLAAGLLGPTLNLFTENAPIWEQRDGDQAPWVFLLSLVGAAIGMALTRDTETLRRAKGPTPVGDLVIVATPCLLFTGVGLASLSLVHAPPLILPAFMAALHLAAMGVLVLPLGPLALVATTWLLPAMWQGPLTALVDPMAHPATPLAQTCLLVAILLASSLRPHALRNPR